ncbi:MAG: amylo-alpha-1,6-glucosidase [Pseudomonadales bacterium]
MLKRGDGLAMEAQERQPPTARTDPVPVDLGREICGDLHIAERREWLVTNGIGGFASGTVAGLLTRRYHGLLFAALTPPLGRTLLVTKLDETAEYDGVTLALFTNRWTGGAVDPHGYRYIERFRLEGTTPVWTFALADALLEKRIWMQQGANTTCIRYDLVRAHRSVRLTLKALVNYRDYHSCTRADGWQFTVEPVEQGLRFIAFDGAKPCYLFSDCAAAEPTHSWYHNFDLAVERYRGLDDREDHLHVGTFTVELRPGGSVTFLASTDPASSEAEGASLQQRLARERTLLEKFAVANPELSSDVPPWIAQLVLAADQFIVSRPLADQLNGRTVVAGYPWFGDWGRDTMISLPGLTLCTGRSGVARAILRTFSRFTNAGMLPNRFPDAGQAPEYNTVDATLWYFEAVRQYYAATRDKELLREIYPILAEMVDWYHSGTRYNIHVDEKDGLLYAGEAGVQLTWMDAKVGDWVVTPRIGKPVEVNALWLNALVTQSQFANLLKKPAGTYEKMTAQARESFQRFWNGATGWCFDVIDGPDGDDASLRPNQLLAVSLPESPLRPEQQRAVVDVCARRLLTSFGLRSLAPGDPHYKGHYGGDPVHRDGAYHPGTGWGWLLGPFVLAHLRVHQDPARAMSFLEPLAHHLQVHGVGTASEIFDGDPPFAARGCIAQAWTVAEVLRAWLAVRSAP